MSSTSAPTRASDTSSGGGGTSRDELRERKVAVIEPSTAGFDATAIISVALERDRRDLIDGFKRRARGEDRAQRCYCVAGDVDFVLTVPARALPDYEAFIERFFLGDGVMRSFPSWIVVSRVKADAFVPFGPDDQGAAVK